MKNKDSLDVGDPNHSEQCKLSKWFEKPETSLRNRIMHGMKLTLNQTDYQSGHQCIKCP